MSKDKQQTVTQVTYNNAKAPTTVTKVVELVVINNRLVPDDQDINPGVVIRGT